MVGEVVEIAEVLENLLVSLLALEDLVAMLVAAAFPSPIGSEQRVDGVKRNVECDGYLPIYILAVDRLQECAVARPLAQMCFDRCQGRSILAVRRPESISIGRDESFDVPGGHLT